MIKHFMTDYLGLLAYSDWLRDEGKEEEAIAFTSAIMEERGWSDLLAGIYGDGSGRGEFLNNAKITGNGEGAFVEYGCGYGYITGDGQGFGIDEHEYSFNINYGG